MDIPKYKVIGLALVVLIVSGSVALTFVPEVLSFECLTSDHQWIEDGIHYIGNQVNCP